MKLAYITIILSIVFLAESAKEIDLSTNDKSLNQTELIINLNNKKVDISHKMFRSPLEVFKIESKVIHSSIHEMDPKLEFFKPITFNGFMDSLYYAYTYHLDIKISASDFLNLINIGISGHINYNAEELRSEFVNFEGKKDLIVERNNEPWDVIFPKFGEAIKKSVKNSIYDVMIDDFSTSTKMSKIASELALMSSMKNYFTYIVETLCGINNIILVGSKEDWNRLGQKVKLLNKLNENNRLKLDFWLKNLNPIIEKIVEAGRDGIIDKKFWDSIYKLQHESGTSLINGWITKLNPYLKDRNNNIIISDFEYCGIDNIINSVYEVDLIWENNGFKIFCILKGGFFGAKWTNGIVENEYFYFIAYDKEKNKLTQKEDL